MKKNNQPKPKLPTVTIEHTTLEGKIEHLKQLGLTELFTKYRKALDKELEMRLRPLQTPEILYNAEPIYYMACSILEVAENSTVLRCCAKNGHVTEDKVAFESVGAHTNLAAEIADVVLDALYGWGNDTPRYTRYEFTKALRYHDLPENETGDGEDNLSRDESAKAQQEKDYFDTFTHYYSSKYDLGFFHVKELLLEMQELNTEDGRIAYLADKLAAIVMVLCYQRLKVYMYAYKTDPCISPVNLEEIKMCENTYEGGYLFSEMWTNDFVYARELTRYDDSGYFTALLIMITLICRDNHWYNWRLMQRIP